MASYTKDQEVLVERILKFKATEYYKILDVDRGTCTEADIKRLYRKLAIKLHPDKNSHPRAAEAFKFTAKAYEVLSDADKKRVYDQTGVDPDSRGGGGGASASGFARGGHPGGGVHPFEQFFAQNGFAQGGHPNDDLFNMFFGGGGGGRPQTFTFGPGGFQFTSFGGPGGARGFAQRPQQQAHEEPGMGDTLRQLLPILLFLLVPLLSNLLLGLGLQPTFLFEPSGQRTVHKETLAHKVLFFILPDTDTDVFGHLDQRQQRRFETKVEKEYSEKLRRGCSYERQQQHEMIEQASGWFFTDEELLRQATLMPMPNCERLRAMSLL